MTPSAGEKTSTHSRYTPTRTRSQQTTVDQSYLDRMTAAYEHTGFFGINSLYMNDADNRAFVDSAGVTRMTMPTLFMGCQWDYVNDTAYSRLAEPMRAQCTDLDHRVLDAGHWVHHEREAEVIDAIESLVTRAETAA
jgi:soluble epoxide hydrolase/lipid-phosphate phosphatase